MPQWYTRLDNNLRASLASYGKSYEDIEKGCVLMDKSLNILLEKQKPLKDYGLENLIEEAIDHFYFCKDFATGDIKREDWDDYDFDGDLLGLFNSYMNEFWDICDYIVNDKPRYHPDVKKFCWVVL